MTLGMNVTNNDSVLTITDLCIQRGDVQLVRNLNAQLSANQVLHFVGRNGVGKSTLLAMLVGLVPIQQGFVSWNQLSPINWSCLYISHHKALDDFLTVRQNLTFLCHLQIQDYKPQPTELVTKSQTPKLIKNLLTKINLEWYAQEPVMHLSSGQKQRLQLAKLWLDWHFMTLLPKTEQIHFAKQRLWVLDEPFTALDADFVQRTQELCNLFCQLGGRIIITSHQAIDHITASLQVINLDTLVANHA